MSKATFALAALTLGALSASVSAAPRRAAKQFPEGTHVVIVGRISSQPRNVKFAHERKMQVSVGPNRRDYTLHIDDARIIGTNGGVGRVSDLRDRWWVRAEGRVMDDPKRIDVDSVRVISKNRDSLVGTAYNRAGMPHGYVTAVAGSRQWYPHRP